MPENISKFRDETHTEHLTEGQKKNLSKVLTDGEDVPLNQT